MAKTGGGDPSHCEAANVSGAACEVETSTPSGCVAGDRVDRGQPGETADHPSSENIHPSHYGDVEDGGALNGNVKIPPWTISLVALTGPTTMEVINIPRDEQSEVAEMAPEIKYVSAMYASQLLKQIAGLTAIARQRAQEARDLLCKYRRHTEALLAHQMSGVMAVQQEAIQLHNRDCRNNIGFARYPFPVDSGASRVCKVEHGVSELDKHGEIYCVQHLEQKIPPEVHSSLNPASDEESHTRLAQEGERLQANNDSIMVDACTNEVCVETDHPNRRRRARPSVSLKEEDVIYGSWKMTKSA